MKTVADNALKECREDGLDIKMCIVVKNLSAEGDGTNSPKQKKAKTSVSFALDQFRFKIDFYKNKLSSLKMYFQHKKSRNTLNILLKMNFLMPTRETKLQVISY